VRDILGVKYRGLKVFKEKKDIQALQELKGCRGILA
jgi:hypothetical protein